MNRWFPTFSYLKCATACLSLKPGCRSTDVCSHFSSAYALWTSAAKAENSNQPRKVRIHFFRNVGAIIQQPLRPMAWLTPVRAVNSRSIRRMHWAARDEIFSYPEQDRSDSFSLQGKSAATANIDRILGPFLPAASAIVARCKVPFAFLSMPDATNSPH